MVAATHSDGLAELLLAATLNAASKADLIRLRSWPIDSNHACRTQLPKYVIGQSEGDAWYVDRIPLDSALTGKTEFTSWWQNGDRIIDQELSIDRYGVARSLNEECPAFGLDRTSRQ